MKHREAIRHLPLWKEAALGPTTEAALRSHVQGCSGCTDWLTTHDLLAEQLRPAEWGSAEHPESSLLALCAVRPAEVYEPGQEDLERHLRSCPTCRELLEAMTDAVATARPRSTVSPSRPLRIGSSAPVWKHALAAGAAAFLVGAGLLVAPALLERGRDVPTASFGPLSASDPGVEELVDHDLDGTRLIRAEGGLRVARVRVSEGADITLEARDGIALGDGFRVATGGRLTVGSGHLGWSDKAPNDESTEPEKR